ncbi:RCBTB2 [Symbiodinium sp. CCMP2592]|nr:RCBTB2 [Symbiodinium sp. CCMP2592]
MDRFYNVMRYGEPADFWLRVDPGIFVYPNSGDGNVICFPCSGGARRHFGGTETKHRRSDLTQEGADRRASRFEWSQPPWRFWPGFLARATVIMEKALRSLRQLSAGLGTEPAVFQAAARVPALDDVGMEAKSCKEEGSDSESEAEFEPVDPNEQSELYTWGRATNYQLGYGAGTEQQIPKLVQLPSAKLVTHLSCGRFHSTAVTACGRVFTWGVGGASGRLGLELSKKTEAVVVEPMALPQFGPGRHHATKAVAGLNHTLALTSAGKLLVWGANDKGQLGCGQPGETALQPVVMKVGPFQKLRVSDIAAGAAHSLCIAGEGSVYAWGCNGRGALGLGAPPSGPLQVAQPQSLPHLKAATCVDTNSGGTISVCLVGSHGDAIMFGGSPIAAAAGDSRNPVDNRFFTPGRVRRKDPELTEMSGNDDWQLQRGTQLSPLRAISVSDSECFGIDSDGLLWVWPTTCRPVTADLVALNLTKAVPPSRLPSAPEVRDSGEFVMIETDGLLEEPERIPPSALYTDLTDRPREIEIAGVHAIGHAMKAGTMWAVDDSDARHLWQLKRPSKPDGDWAAERFEHLAQVSCFACGPEHQAAVVKYTMPCFDEASQAAEGAQAVVKPKSNVLSLQQLCENKLCAKLSPRSFGLVCDIAWELNRPTLLDRAFRFLCANAPLMFSRLHLPMLSQKGRWSTAASEVLSLLAVSLPGTAGGQGPTAERLGLDFSATEVQSLQEEQLEAETKKKKKASAGTSPALPQKSSPVSSKASPKSAAVSPYVQPERSSPSIEVQDWVEVRSKPRKGSQELPSQSPKAKPVESPLLAEGTREAEPPFGGREFGEEVSMGPSPMLVSAVSAVECKERGPGQGWGTQGPQAAKASVPLPEIIEEEARAKSKVKASQRSAKQAKITTCSWGRDAIPSEQPRNQSIDQIQEEEEHIRQQDEIAEIEAMFAALEVAEIQEALEREGASSGNGERKASTAKARGGIAPAAGKASEAAKSRAGEGRNQRRSGRNGYKSDWWSQDWTGSSWNSGWWESGKQTHWQRREAPEDRADTAEGSHA